MTFIKFVESNLGYKVIEAERRKSILYLGKEKPTNTFFLNFAKEAVPSKEYIYELYDRWIRKYHEGGI